MPRLISCELNKAKISVVTFEVSLYDEGLTIFVDPSLAEVTSWLNVQVLGIFRSDMKEHFITSIFPIVDDETGEDWLRLICIDYIT